MIKNKKQCVVAFFAAFCLPVLAFAAGLSKEELSGKWIYVRIVAEDYTVDVNRYIDFKADNTVVTYVVPDQELSSARYRVGGNEIVYSDEKGDQHWVVLNFDGGTLSVDHQGAKMFFKRPAN